MLCGPHPQHRGADEDIGSVGMWSLMVLLGPEGKHTSVESGVVLFTTTCTHVFIILKWCASVNDKPLMYSGFSSLSLYAWHAVNTFSLACSATFALLRIVSQSP